ncbi:polyprenyl synthetase family protein [Streptomyces olivoreticuli]
MTLEPAATVGTQTAVWLLASARRRLELPLGDALATLPPSVATVAAYQCGLADEPSGEPRGAGKAVRPALVLAASMAVGGQAEHSLPAAVAVELVHNSSLLHDDIIDNDTQRRHRPAAWTRFGTGRSLLTGDVLLALAWEVLLRVPRHQGGLASLLLARAVRELAHGQAWDVDFEGRATVSVQEYLTMAAAKTAALLKCSCALGALLGGGDAGAVDALADYGHHLGMVLQLTDDVLGVWGDPAVTGKPVGSDIRARKKSLPVVLALATRGRHAERLADLYAQPGQLTGEQVRTAIELIDRTGARARMNDVVNSQLRRIHELLTCMNLTGQQLELLTALARYLAHRRH